MDRIIILADTEVQPSGQAGAAAPAGQSVAGGNTSATVQQPAGSPPPASKQPEPIGGGMGTMLLWLGVLFVVMWLFVIRPKKKEEKAKQALLSALKKGDKVLTIGGMVGTVMDLRDDEVVLKVDENTNTRIRFARSAVSRIMGEETAK